jgi:hypothetical protein
VDCPLRKLLRFADRRGGHPMWPSSTRSAQNRFEQWASARVDGHEHVLSEGQSTNRDSSPADGAGADPKR